MPVSNTVVAKGDIRANGRTAEIGVSVAGRELRCEIHVGRGPEISGVAEAAAALALRAAMKLGVPLVVEHPLSARFLDGLEQMQAITRLWFPELTRIEIEHGGIAPPAPPGPRSGVLFSGGVDSTYTALKHPEADLIHATWPQSPPP
jgi:hypothetical protein